MLWLKAFHIVAVVCWFAGLFYLPRLFVYHVDTPDAAGRERFATMERKLYRGIMTPSLLATVILGGWLLVEGWPYYATQGWMHAKLFLAALLIGYHHACGVYRRQLAEERCRRSGRFFRVFNELPVLVLVAIVVLVVVRPF